MATYLHSGVRHFSLAAVVFLNTGLMIFVLNGEAQSDPSREITLVVLGDSLSAGYGLPAGKAYPAQLEAALRARGNAVRVINAGVSGDTASGGLARLDWSVPKRADAVIVELGGNDALRGLDPAVTFRSLDAIITRLKGKGISVLLAGMEAPRSLGTDYTRAFAAIYPRLADKHGIQLYPFFLDGVILQRRYMMPDGIHPNEKGVAEIVRRMVPLVEKLIRNAAARHE